MTHNRLLNQYLICALILITGLGLALFLPRFVSSQGLAAQSEVGEQSRAPEVTRYYVAKTGNGTDPTAGWDTAFDNLHDALALAATAEETPEIWVAEGIYYPDEGSGQIDNNFNATFNITKSVTLYGGFDISDTNIDERDWKNNITVLSGDIDENDITDANGVVTNAGNIIGENAYNVIIAENVAGSAVLDGFTITAGKARGVGGEYFDGGGFYCNGKGKGNKCSPTLRNVTFSGNRAYDYGGAMYNNGSNGGISSPSLTNVTFSGNSAPSGGAMYNNGLMGNISPKLINVEFSGNSAPQGGGMYNDGSNSPTSIPNLTNVTFSGNSAHSGGAIYNSEISNMVVRNSVLWNNLDNSGPGTISSTIYNDGATVTLVHSLVQGAGASGSDNWTTDTSYVDGGNNIDQNPMFITPIDPNTAPTSAGNLRLQSSSPAINAGNNVYATVFNDLDNSDRIVDGIVDMGAYEYHIKYVGYLPIVYR